MRVLRITRSASKFIERESRKCCSETGGLLIGTLRQPTVMKASKAGERAKKTFGSYSNDADYDNKTLQKIMDHSNGKLKLVGYWHKHPGTMSSPSSVDLATAKDIIAKNDLTDRRPVFFVITNVIDQKVEMHGYSLRFNQKNFGKTKIETVRDNSKEVKKALQLEPTVILPRRLSYWRDFDFQFYLTEVGNKRLKEEIDELITNGYAVRAFAKDNVRLIIAREETIVCIPPPEYPLNPPRFFRSNAEIEYSMPMWNSSFRIIDVLKVIKKRGGSYENHSARAGSKTLETIKQIKRTIESIWSNKKKRRFMLRS